MHFNLKFFPQNSTPDEVRYDVEYACMAWAKILDHPIEVNVDVYIADNLGGGLNGVCVPGIFQEKDQTLTRPQSKMLEKIDPNDAKTDLVIVLHKTGWVFGDPGQIQINGYSLRSTMLHEICHGLGFTALCNIDSHKMQGLYTDVSLVNLIQKVLPNVVKIPPHFFVNLQSGYQFATPFAKLFRYSDESKMPGIREDDYQAFTKPDSIELNIPGYNYSLYTVGPPDETNFKAFTGCEHIVNYRALKNQYLMYNTKDLYFPEPDAPSKQILKAIGWNVPGLI